MFIEVKEEGREEERVRRREGGKDEWRKEPRQFSGCHIAWAFSCRVKGTSKGLSLSGSPKGQGARKASLLARRACPCLLSLPVLTSGPGKREMSEGERKKD